jgi:hypothetical protein
MAMETGFKQADGTCFISCSIKKIRSTTRANRMPNQPFFGAAEMKNVDASDVGRTANKVSLHILAKTDWTTTVDRNF